MIPLRDQNPSHRRPLVNYALIALCTAVFALEFRPGGHGLISSFAIVPGRFFSGDPWMGFMEPYLYVTLVTSAFLHADIFHFGGNMLFLWIFGDNVEDRMGHLRYLLFYLLGAVAAGLAQAYSEPNSMVPLIGASGAIAAVMGAYLLMYPRARIASAVIFLFFIRIIYVPAMVYLPLWFALQIFSGAAASTVEGQGGVAWWAHAGGFVFGFAAVFVLGLRRGSWR